MNSFLVFMVLMALVILIALVVVMALVLRARLYQLLDRAIECLI